MTNSIINDIKIAFKNGNYLIQVIVINLAVFLLLNVFKVITPVSVSQSILQFLALSANLFTDFYKVWGYVTYMFTHEDLWHLVFNLMWLYYPGRILVDLYGQKRFLELYIVGGLCGGILFVVMVQILPSFAAGSFLIGASASVMAILIAVAALQPDYTVHLLIFGPVKLKYVALVGFLMSSVVDLNLNTGGKIAHFGGALFGAYYAYSLKNGKEVVTPLFDLLKKIFTPSKLKVVHKNKTTHTKTNSSHDLARMDQILDKISKYGYDSLSKEEKEYLFKFNK